MNGCVQDVGAEGGRSGSIWTSDGHSPSHVLRMALQLTLVLPLLNSRPNRPLGESVSAGLPDKVPET